MCLQFGHTKQAYYKQLKTAENTALQNDLILGLIKQKREIWKRGSGRNLHKSLEEDFKNHQIKMGRDLFFEFLRAHDFLIKSKRFKIKTTCSYHHFNKFEYLIKGLIPLRSNEIWVSDITYLWITTNDIFCYLSIITDLYSRKIVGHCVHENLSVNGCLVALYEAIEQREDKTQSLIHHSDRGVQYCCNLYVNTLHDNKIQISMTQTGDPLENAVAERINKTIKEEFTNDKQINFINIAEAKAEIKKFIDFYNNQRPHRSVNWMTPTKAHEQTGALKRAWKKYSFKKKNGEDLIEAYCE